MRMKAACAMALLLLACSGDDEETAPTAPATPEREGGRWFGFIVDGNTGAKLDFFSEGNATDDDGATDQIYVLADGEFKTARPCEPGDANEDNAIPLNGCFVVDGLPLGVSMPVFVERDGYHSFASTISIDPVSMAPNAAHEGFELEQPLLAEQPSLYANVRVFPVGGSYDYTLTTTIHNEAASGIQVRCVFDSAANAFDTVGGSEPSTYLPPTNDFNPILTATTGDEGHVTFSAEELTIGASYQCFAGGADPLTGSPVSNSGSVSFTVGVSATLVAVPMAVAGDDVVAVWNNFGDDNSPLGSLDGPLTVVFNRPVALLAGSEDCHSAFDLGVALPDDANPDVTELVLDEDNDGSESLAVALDETGTTLTITPLYETRDPGDRDIRVSFGGIFLVAQNGQARVYGIGAGAGTGPTSAFTLHDIASTCGAVNATPLVDALTSSALPNRATLVGP